LAEPRVGASDPIVQDRIEELLDRVGTRGEALLVLEGDPFIAERHGIEPQGMRDEIYLGRRQRVNAIVTRVVERSGGGLDARTRLGHALLRPLTGIPVLAAVLFLMYEFLGVFVAQTVVGFTEGTIMHGYVEPLIRQAVGAVVGTTGVLYQLLAGDFGVLTLSTTYIFGLLLPLVIGFYLLMSLLEDSGYLPRIAALTDRMMTAIGLNGRAIIPMILGFGCITMATITTRILGNERERKIATALMAFAIPCSAQLGVITGLLAGAGGLSLTLAYATIMVLIFGVLGVLMARFVPGESTDLLIDLPPLRLPRLKNVLTKTYRKTIMFLREVGLYFVAGSLLLGVLQITGALVAAQTWLAPLTEEWLLLPRETATAFIMGFVRRDFGAAGLYSLGLSGADLLVALVTITLFVPCIASVLVITKERGKSFAALIWVGSVVLAFLFGGVLAHVASWVA
jgi:ferrous iron transport protein B